MCRSEAGRIATLFARLWVSTVLEFWSPRIVVDWCQSGLWATRVIEALQGQLQRSYGDGWSNSEPSCNLRKKNRIYKCTIWTGHIVDAALKSLYSHWWRNFDHDAPFILAQVIVPLTLLGSLLATGESPEWTQWSGRLYISTQLCP